MKREGWESRLIAYLHTVSGRVLDCDEFFGDAVTAIRDDSKDYYKPWRGKNKTVARKKAALRRKGFADHVAYVESVMATRPSPMEAQRGDGAVVLDDDGNMALGIVQGERVYVMTPAGLGLVCRSKMIKAFEI